LIHVLKLRFVICLLLKTYLARCSIKSKEIAGLSESILYIFWSNCCSLDHSLSPSSPSPRVQTPITPVAPRGGYSSDIKIVFAASARWFGSDKRDASKLVSHYNLIIVLGRVAS
jgi:hypothetical protein